MYGLKFVCAPLWFTLFSTADTWQGGMSRAVGDCILESADLVLAPVMFSSRSFNIWGSVFPLLNWMGKGWALSLLTLSHICYQFYTSVKPCLIFLRIYYSVVDGKLKYSLMKCDVSDSEYTILMGRNSVLEIWHWHTNECIIISQLSSQPVSSWAPFSLVHPLCCLQHCP